MGSFITETSVRNVLSERIADGEKLDVVARGTDMLGRPHYVGRTDRRGIVLRLSKSYEPRDEESIPLKKLDKKLARMALGKGLWLSPPGELHFTTEKEKGLFATEKETLEEHLEEGEEIMTLGMARDPDISRIVFYYLAFTDRRLLMARLRGDRVIADVEGIPLAALEFYELRNGDDAVPIDIPAMSSQEQKLYLKYKGGRERKFLLTDMFGHRREDAPD